MHVKKKKTASELEVSEDLVLILMSFSRMQILGSLFLQWTG